MYLKIIEIGHEIVICISRLYASKLGLFLLVCKYSNSKIKLKERLLISYKLMMSLGRSSGTVVRSPEEQETYPESWQVHFDSHDGFFDPTVNLQMLEVGVIFSAKF